MNVRAGSLFSGVGLLDFGLTLAGIEHAWLCEADPWRREILNVRWPGVPVYEDVRAVDGSCPRIDLLVGGFPCRGASTAGDRSGMDHPETALWREMARIAGELRPRYLLLENVANLLAVRRGAAWGEVLGDLASLGYVCAWDCLPAAAFGAPHRRDRVFAIAAHADGQGAGRDGSLGREQDGRADVGGGASADASSPDGQGAHGGREALGGAPGDDGNATPDPGEPGRQERDGTEPGEPQLPAADARPAPDPDRGRLQAGPQQDLGTPTGQPAPLGDDADGLRLRDQWGQYAGAVRRWEEVAGPAPESLVRGLDARGARRLVRSQLSAYGDGVQVDAGRFIGEHLLQHIAATQKGPIAA